MSDACGCGHDEPRPEGEEEREPEKLWQITEIRAAAVAGVLLAVGLIVEWTGGPRLVALTVFSLALFVAGYTFVPSTLKRLVQGKIGVGTLMTIAAVGAVLLGKVEEAAMLAFLFAISEGLEEYSVTRTRRGLRALLSLVPATATVIRDGREQTVPPAELRLGEMMIVKPGE
ncbi:cation-transporting P-type ATPase, partial [Antrihabitans sp. NCIMB 15448]